VGGVHIKHFLYYFFIDIMSGLFLVAESSGDLIFAPKIFFCAGIGLKWGVFCHLWGQD
jgi:hypothetical protein